MLIADRYEIISELGVGGMGTVYKARHVHLGKIVAVKVLNGEKHDANQIQRFAHEAKVVSQLEHPNIVAVQDYGVTAEGSPFLVMEFVQGRTLDKMLEEGGPLGVESAMPIFEQICVALEHIHAAGVVHRDLKPSNILIAEDADGKPIVKIADFGIAKEVTNEQKLTQTGTVLGSPLYSSPEQLTGEKVGNASDIYSLGCLMYEVLCGEPPFRGENTMQTFMKHLNSEPPRLATKGGAKGIDVPPWMENVILKALSKDQRDRQQSAAMLLQELNKGTAGWNGRMIRTTRRAWHRKLARNFGIAAMLIVCLYVPLMMTDENVARIKLSVLRSTNVDEEFLTQLIAEGNQSLQKNHDKAALMYYDRVIELTDRHPNSVQRAEAMAGRICISGLRLYPRDKQRSCEFAFKNLSALIDAYKKKPLPDQYKDFVGALAHRAYKCGRELEPNSVTNEQFEKLIAPLIAAGNSEHASDLNMMLAKRSAKAGDQLASQRYLKQSAALLSASTSH